MKDIRQMAEMGASMKEIREYVNAELMAAEKIIKEKKEAAEKAAQQKHATDIFIDATIAYAKAFGIIPQNEEVPPELKETLIKLAANTLPATMKAQSIKPIESKENPHTVEVELDEKELDELIKTIFG